MANNTTENVAKLKSLAATLTDEN